MSRKCSSCGFSQNPDNAHYCGKCGEKVDSYDNWKLYDDASCEVVFKSKLAEYKRYEEKYIVLWRSMVRARARTRAFLFIGIVVVFGFFGFAFFWGNRNNVSKYSILSNNGYYSLFKKDKQLTPYQYDTLVLYSNDNGDLSYVIAKQRGKYGRLDRNGQVLDSCIYDRLYSFKEGWAITEVNGLFGYVKEKKKGDIQVITPSYLQAGAFSQGFSRIQYADKSYGWIDSKGHEVSWGNVYYCGDYSDGYAWISIDSQGKEFGYVDRKGNVTNVHAAAATQFDNGRAFFTKDGGGWAMIDRNLKQVTDFVLYPRTDPSTKQYIRPLFRYDSQKKLWLCVYNGEESFINKKGEILNNSQ